MAGQFIISYLNNCTEVKQISGLIGIGLSDTHELDQKAILPNTLLIRGELDLSIGLNASNAWKHRENVRQFVIPNAKHLCHINNPQLFNKVLINFLNSISV
jgi:pimeloyl-ACP methyl ester carboxylesterase